AGVSPRGHDVAINTVPCRVPFVRAAGAPTPQALASRIAQIIHANRELLVDARIAEANRAVSSSELSGLFLPRLSRSAFLDYLRLLLRGCFRLDPADFAKDSGGPGAATATARGCYEERVRLLSGLGCRLLRPPGQTDGALEGLLEQMREGLFYELGVRLPQVRLDEDDTLRKGEFRIQINDLRLPKAVGLGDS